MLIWAIPAIAWAVHGTVFSVTDFLRTVSKPLLSAIVAAVWRIVLTWFVTGQKQLYVELSRAVGSKSPSMEKEVLMSTGA